MEVRDSDEKLTKLLESLRIDVEGGLGPNKDSNAPPTLPLIDQLRLLSAHIDSYRKTLAETVIKAESIAQIEKHERSGKQIQSRIEEIESKIKRLSDDKRSTTDGTDVDILQLNVSRSVTEYVKSKQEYENRRHTTILATALREAVAAVEQLEARIVAGDFDPKGIREGIAQAQNQCARLGVRSSKDELGSNVEFVWLGTGTSAPPAIQQLGQRLNLLIKQVEQIIRESWHDCLRIGYSENECQANVTVASRSNVAVEGHRSQLSLPTLLALLKDRAELIPFLNSFSNNLVNNVITPLLTIRQTGSTSNWQEVSSSGSWQVLLNSAGGKPESALQAISALLVYMKAHFFKVAENVESLGKLQFEFSRIIIPATIPLVIKYLRSLLPKTLQKPIRQETLGSLSAVSKIAIDVHTSLKDNGYLIGGLEEEGEELLDFAHNTGRYFLRHLTTISRSQARDLLLKEMNGGWEGVKVEMEVEVIQPPPSIAQIQPEQVRIPNTKEEAEDEDWSAWDDAGAQGESHLSVANVKKAAGLDLKPTRVASAQSQRSASPASITSNRAKQKKSALGGVRVVKPQDQLGSGPFPDENLDETSWGFDEVGQSHTAQASSSKISNSAHASMTIADDEEDAWFQEEPAEQSTASVAHTSISANNSLLSAPPPVDDEDDGDAWFQDEPAGRPDDSSNSDEAWFKDDMSVSESQSKSKDKESPIRRAHPIETISQSSSLSSPAIIDHNDLEDEDIDEDAWGLTEEEKAKRASIRASRGGTDLANAFKAFAEKEKAATTVERSAPLIDVTEEDETESSIKIKEDTQQTLNESTFDGISTPLLHPVEPPIQKEACIISQRSISFVKLASSILDDIIAIEEEDDKTLGLDTKYLADALNDILDLHRALMPVGHAETLNNVPTLAAQFVNDCTYIAKELVKLDERWKQTRKNKDLGALTLAKHAELTVLLGQRSFDAQILVQQRILAECLADAHGFEATYDEQRFHACMRSIRQVIVVLQQLHSAWKPVLTTSSHQAAMGRLIDSVLQKVLRDITGLEDISEVEGEKLSNLVKALAELEDIFRTEKHKQEEQPSSDVAIFVPSWFKASYLSDILTGSLVDIEFLYFEAGALVDYTREELTSLIRALFSDTPKRSRLIERIQSSSSSSS